MRPAVEAVGAREDQLGEMQGESVSARAVVVRADFGDGVGTPERKAASNSLA